MREFDSGPRTAPNLDRFFYGVALFTGNRSSMSGINGTVSGGHLCEHRYFGQSPEHRRYVGKPRTKAERALFQGAV